MRLHAERRADLIVLLGLLFVAAVGSLSLSLNLTWSFLLYLLVPAIYLCLRKKKNYIKIFLSSTIITLFLGGTFYILAAQNNAWTLNFGYPPLEYTLWGTLPIGALLWGFCVAFFSVVFYEHFLDDERHPALSKHFLYALIPLSVWFVATGSVAVLAPELQKLPYAYLLLLGVGELPLLWALWRRPTLFHKLLLLGAFFFVLNFIFELTALHLDQWSFSGDYIGWVSIMGLSFPLEEFVLWMALSSPIMVFYYEELFDDGK